MKNFKRILLNHKGFTIISIVCSILLTLWAISGDNILIYITLSLSLLCVSKIEYSASLFFLETIFISGTSFLILCSIPLLISVLLSKKHLNNNKSICTACCIFTAYVTINTALFSSIGSMQLSYQAIVIAIDMLIISTIKEFNNEKLLNILLLLSIPCVCILFWQMTFHPQYYAEDILKIQRASFSETTNSNSAAFTLSIFALIILVNVFVYNRWILLIPYLLAFYSIFLTGSRTSLIANVFVFTVLFFLYYKASILKKLGIVLLIFCVGTILFKEMVLSNDDILQRFVISNIIDEGGSGRLGSIQIVTESIIKKNPLFGVGYGKNNMTVLGGMDCDNMLYDLLSQTGIIGTVLFLWMLFATIKQSYKYLHVDKIAILPLILILQIIICSFGETMFDSVATWSIIILCLISTNGFNNHIISRDKIKFCTIK